MCICHGFLRDLEILERNSFKVFHILNFENSNFLFEQEFESFDLQSHPPAKCVGVKRRWTLGLSGEDVAQLVKLIWRDKMGIEQAITMRIVLVVFIL